MRRETCANLSRTIYHSHMRVLIVEDDPLLANGLTETLRREGYVADAVTSAERADAALKVVEVDLVILDIGLPGIDGFEWLKRVRARGGEQAVLVLTARDAVADRVHGLMLGADDYLAKPFATEEFIARVSALARRGRGVGKLEIDVVDEDVLSHAWVSCGIRVC